MEWLSKKKKKKEKYEISLPGKKAQK